mmetsp:Transcript_59959/g.160674  ORF Transcript_59959/g.160674 Transcript_59959/m.160674 type:complete len:252 (-) Transcript_59959:159-914(-)
MATTPPRKPRSKWRRGRPTTSGRSTTSARCWAGIRSSGCSLSAGLGAMASASPAPTTGRPTGSGPMAAPPGLPTAREAASPRRSTSWSAASPLRRSLPRAETRPGGAAVRSPTRSRRALRGRLTWRRGPRPGSPARSMRPPWTRPAEQLEQRLLQRRRELPRWGQREGGAGSPPPPQASWMISVRASAPSAKALRKPPRRRQGTSVHWASLVRLPNRRRGAPPGSALHVTASRRPLLPRRRTHGLCCSPPQ